MGITVSAEQARCAPWLCDGLPVEIRLEDYRSLEGSFDQIASNSLKTNGLFLIQTIGSSCSGTTTERWIERYIFPNSMIPSPNQICSASEGVLVLEDWHSFGADYDKTLMHWFANFHRNWNTIASDYGQRCYRMWIVPAVVCRIFPGQKKPVVADRLFSKRKS